MIAAGEVVVSREAYEPYATWVLQTNGKVVRRYGAESHASGPYDASELRAFWKCRGREDLIGRLDKAVKRLEESNVKP